MYKPLYPGTYYFNNFTFTTMGNSGHRGPTSDQTYADAPWPSSSYFSIENGQQNWSVPANGVYQLTAAGAYGATPGRVVTSQVTLSQGQVLTMLVGQEPTPLTANVADNVTVGGGGGTFVVTNGIPLIVASGGDGSGSSSSSGSFLPSGPGTGGSGAGYYGNGSQTNPYFQFLVPNSYVNGGYGNRYEYGQPTLSDDGGFGGGQSPINIVTAIDRITVSGGVATCNTHVPHGYPYNYIVKISGTTYYDGTQNITVKASNVFTFSTSNTQTVTTGTVSGLATGSSGGGGYTGSPGDGVSGATCYADASVQNFTDLGATSNSAGYVSISLVNPIPVPQSITWNQTWTNRPSKIPYTTTWSSVAYGNGTYVAVSNNGTYPVMYSKDGINWSIETFGSVVKPWVSVTYGNGSFVTVGNDHSVMSSSDGINWTNNGVSLSGNWAASAYGNGVFVSLDYYGYSPYIAGIYSYNGVDYLQSNAPYGNWACLIYAQSKFVASGSGGFGSSGPFYGAMTSLDGINWTKSLSAPIGGWYGLAYGNGTFVAVDDGYSSGTVISSSDGDNWTVRTAPSQRWQAVAYGNGIFVAVGWSTSGYTGKIITSSDGISWTTQTFPVAGYPSQQFVAVSYGNGTFVIVDTNGQKTLTSPNGVTWTVRTPGVSFTGQPPQTKLYFVNGKFYYMNYNYILSSSDGISWTNLTSTMKPTFPVIFYVNGTYYCPPNVISYDGINGLTKNFSSVTYGNGKFIGLSTSFPYSYSTDGLAWTLSNTLTIDTWSSIAYGSGKFATVAKNGTTANVAYSSDGVTWSNATTGTTSNTWTAVAYGNGTFVTVAPQASGLASNVMYSTNGQTWIQGSPISFSSNCIAYGGGYFAAPSSNASIASVGLLTGTTWSYSKIPSASYTGITYGTPGFSAVSSSAIAFNFTPTFWFDVRNLQNKNLQFSNWQGITFGNGVWVAAGNGYIQTSRDIGNTWSTYISSNISCITYSRETGTFVAISNTFTNGTYTSTDGLTWTQYKNLPTNVNSASTSIAYGNGLYVSVLNGDSNVLYSRDGQYWSAVNVSSGIQPWNSVAYGNGQFVAVASNGYKMTSTNGTTWSVLPTPPTSFFSITYGNGKYVAIGYYTTSYGNPVGSSGTSSDGISWSTVTVYNYYWCSIAYGNGIFVAVGTDGTNVKLMTSSNGTSWTETVLSITVAWYSVVYANGKFVAVGDTIYTSTNGTTWVAAQTVPAHVWVAVTYGNGTFVALGVDSASVQLATSKGGTKLGYTSGGPYIATSTDGNTWNSAQTVPSSFNGLLYVTYGKGIFVASSTRQIYASSDNGNTWTIVTPSGDASGLSYGNGIFTNSNLWSTDGYTWTGASTGIMYSTTVDGSTSSIIYGLIFQQIIYVNGIFVGVGSYGTGVSTDGKSWSSQPVVGPIIYANNRWISSTASSYNSPGAIAYSNDGITFFCPANPPFPVTVQNISFTFGTPRISYGNGYFMYLINCTPSDSGSLINPALRGLLFTVAYSQDGVNWSTLLTTFLTTAWGGLAYGQNTFMALNATGGTTMITQLGQTF